MSQTIVQVENLNLTYKSLSAIQNVSFYVRSGEILAVIGQNGSGKTSAVECVEGLRKPDSGLIQVFGKDPWLHRTEVYKEMAFSFRRRNIPQKSEWRSNADCLQVFTKDRPIGIYY